MSGGPKAITAEKLVIPTEAEGPAVLLSRGAIGGHSPVNPQIQQNLRKPFHFNCQIIKPLAENYFQLDKIEL
jgi:hypothetical protein